VAEDMTAGLRRLADELIKASSTQQAVKIRAAMIAGCASAPALIQREAMSTLPAKGGLNAWVADATAQVIGSSSGRTAAVLVRARKSGHDLRSINSGAVRHPVFGRWVGGQADQNVKPGYFSRPMERVVAPAVTAAIGVVMTETADELTGG
jgi:hypothetical protein